jgi:Protein trafficking PGA2
MVRIGQYETFSKYIQSYQAKGILQSPLLSFGTQKLMIDWLRLVVLIGGYILLRPILLRLGAKLQEKSLEKEDKRRTDEVIKEEKGRDRKAKEGLEWGANARIRQRKIEERGVIDGEESDSDELEELLEK